MSAGLLRVLVQSQVLSHEQSAVYQEALKRYQAITTANIQKLTGDMSVQERIHQ